MQNKVLVIIPLLFYAFFMISILFYTNKNKKSKNYIFDYYLGNRNLNGFVLAMTLVATYIGASSFIGGPSLVNKRGLSWVLLASVQIPIIFLALGILGKKLGILSRKLGSITIIDILKKRYDSKFLTLIISASILIFLITSSIAQFIGGAKLIETILDIPYIYSLAIFSLIVIIYTTFGGFRAIAITDTIQTMVMILAIVVIFITLLINQVGFSNITKEVIAISPKYVEPTSFNSQPFNYTFSFFLLVGVGILGLPSTIVRTLTFKNTKSLHNSMIVGSIALGFLMIGMHLIGYMSIPLVTNSELGDKLVPFLALKYLNPILAGIFLGGPLFAIMSSVDSLLIIISSTLVKDLYIDYINPNLENEKIKKISKIITLIVGILVFLLSIKPMSLIVYINLFSLAGQELIFLIPLLFGIFSKKANKVGVSASIILGITTMFIINIFKINFFNTHYIVLSMLIALLGYFIFNPFGENKKEVIDKFFS